MSSCEVENEDELFYFVSKKRSGHSEVIKYLVYIYAFASKRNAITRYSNLHCSSYVKPEDEVCPCFHSSGLCTKLETTFMKPQIHSRYPISSEVSLVASVAKTNLAERERKRLKLVPEK